MVQTDINTGLSKDYQVQKPLGIQLRTSKSKNSYNLIGILFAYSYFLMLLNINVYLTIPVDITGRVLFDEKFAFTTVHTVEHVEFGPEREMVKLVLITSYYTIHFD